MFNTSLRRAFCTCVVAVVAASSAHAVNIDTSRFFAWQKTPDKQRGNLRIFSPYIFLSKEKCQAKGVGKDFNAKKGASLMPGADRLRHECWAEIPGEIILVCPVAETPTESIGNACTQIPKDAFQDISSLPKAPSF